MNESQQIFSIFFAISLGMIASVQSRWKFFNYPLFSEKETRNRIILSLIIFNLVPIIYFAFIIYFLKIQDICPKQWNIINILLISFYGYIPSLAAYGFYRLWIGLIEKNPKRYYKNSQKDIPIQFQRINISCPMIEPTIEDLGIIENEGLSNIKTGLCYIFIPFISSFVVFLLTK